MYTCSLIGIEYTFIVHSNQNECHILFRANYDFELEYINIHK